MRPIDTRHSTFDWLRFPSTRQVIDALIAPDHSDTVRFVGGCVRDSLLNRRPHDIDIATTFEPASVIQRLIAKGLKVVPTGIEHGTVTAIIPDQNNKAARREHTVEITTLRKDVSTDGRRATVAFTDDWHLDAARRDFTINALYLTIDGTLFDPYSGFDDLKAGRVRFIGNARDRIREDYLRILRFFRFSARFCRGNLDAAGLQACSDLKAGIEYLSRERVGTEFSALMAQLDPLPALRAMDHSGILRVIWDQPADVDATAIVKSIDPHAPAPVMLAALWPKADTASGSTLSGSLRLSNADDMRRRKAIGAAGDIRKLMDEKAATVILYRHGRRAFSDGAMLIGNAALVAFAADTDIPVFPLTGQDVLNLGVSPGPAVSQFLVATENQWISEGFPKGSRAEEILADLVKRSTR